MSTLIIRKKSLKTWLHTDSILGDFIISKFYFNADNLSFQIVEQGQSRRVIYNISDITLYAEPTGGTAETFTTITELSLRLEELNYPAFQYDGQITSIANLIDAGTNITITGDGTAESPYIINSTGGSGSQTLAEVLVEGNITDGTDISISDGDKIVLENGANLKKGTTDAGLGGSKGIALRCAVDYELKWEAGRLYVMGGDGFTIREVSHNFTTTPTATDDDTKGFVIDSRWILDDGDVYVCTDDTTGAAVWVLQGSGTTPTLQEVLTEGGRPLKDITGLSPYDLIEEDKTFTLAYVDVNTINLNEGVFVDGDEIEIINVISIDTELFNNNNVNEFYYNGSLVPFGSSVTIPVGSKAILKNLGDTFVLNIITGNITTPTLQQVTDEGATTTNDITVSKETGTSLIQIANNNNTLTLQVEGTNGSLIELNDANNDNYGSLSCGELVMTSGSSSENIQLNSNFLSIHSGSVKPYIALSGSDGTLTGSVEIKTDLVDGNYEQQLPPKSGTLATLDDITTPTLQEVTDEGNVTTNDIKVNSLDLWDNANGDYANINVNDKQFLFNTHLETNLGVFAPEGIYFGENAVAAIRSNDLTTNRVFELQDQSGTLALLSDIPSSSTFVPYTGATANLDLGTHKLLAKDLDINHTSGSGDAATITKGGSGEALKVVKTSGSGNAASITGGVTLLDELHLTTDLADAYIASASTWNAKQNALGFTPYKFIQTSQTAHTGTTAETILATATINGGTFNSNDIMKMFFGVNKTGTGANYVLRLKINTTNTLTGATQIALWQSASASAQNAFITRNFSLNSGNLIGFSFTISSLTDIANVGGAVSSTTYNTANTLYAFFTVALTNSSDTISFNTCNIFN